MKVIAKGADEGRRRGRRLRATNIATYGFPRVTPLPPAPSTRRNIMDYNFRKIDIDAYDEDIIQESELYDADPRDPAAVLDEAKQRQVAVRSALSK